MTKRFSAFLRAATAGTALMLAGTIAAAPMAQAQDMVSPVEFLEGVPAEGWETLDQENLLYMDLPSGQIIIELRPDFAPAHVQQIKSLTRQGFYNGTIFHRVIEGFMAQGGDPTGTGRGGSELPNIQQEFMRNADAIGDEHFFGRDRRTSQLGFVGPIPVGAQPGSLKSLLVQDDMALWGMHCAGVMSMARSGDPNSANSQFFLMFGDSRRSLDQRYTIWGRIVDGFENARRINRGEPPERPTPINRMRVGSDVPADEQVEVQRLRTGTDTFFDYLRNIRAVSEDGYVRDVCAINVPTKINGEIEL